MKRIIKDITYDTETATEIAKGGHGTDISSASWLLYKTQNGAYFDVEYDHDGSPMGITPLTEDKARKFVEVNANHLYEKLFSPRPEARPLEFSRRTVVSAVNVLAKFSHGDFSEFLVNLSNELYKAIAGEGVSLKKRLIDLKLFVDDNPHYVVDGEPLQKIIIEKAVSFLPEENAWSEPYPNDHPTQILKRSLAQDGFVVTEGVLRRALPETVALVQAENEIVSLLTKHGLAVAQGHLNQAFTALTGGHWASANSQIRSFLEGLFDELAEKLDPTAKTVASGHGRRAKLASLGFLSVDLNEWSDDGKGYVNGLMKRLHPQGSHPGLSDEGDSTFRIQTVLIVAQLYLRRYDKMVTP